MSFRVRFRFRVLKPLDIAEREHRFSLAGREVRVSSLADQAIRDSEWLVMNAGAIESEQAARDFAARLRSAAELVSAAIRLGIDVGRDLPTSGLGAELREHLRAVEGVDYRGNVHGVDVFEDSPNVRFLNVTANAMVLAAPRPFFEQLGSFLNDVPNMSREAREVVLLLNYALMRPDPVAQVVFSISAVEMLGQRAKWSSPQKSLIAHLEREARASPIGTEEERAEVADAVKFGLHKLSLRQGVLRLLADLGLGQLKKPWDELYSERSTLVHGLAPRPGADYSALANKTVSLCGHVLMRYVAREFPGVGIHADLYYPIPAA